MRFRVAGCRAGYIWAGHTKSQEMCTCRLCCDPSVLSVPCDQLSYQAVLTGLTNIPNIVAELERRHVPPVTMWCTENNCFALNLYQLVGLRDRTPQDVCTFLAECKNLCAHYDAIKARM